MSTIVDRQIGAQIEGRIDVRLYTPDLDGDWEPVSLYAQADNNYYISNFGRFKKMPKAFYDELVDMFTGEQEFNTDPEIVRTDMSFDDFFNKYFNNLESVNVGNEN